MFSGIYEVKEFRDIPYSANIGELMLFTTKPEDFAKFMTILTDCDLAHGIMVRQYCVEDIFHFDDIYEESESKDHYFEILARKISKHFEVNIKNFINRHLYGVILIAERDEVNECWDFKTLTHSNDIYTMKDSIITAPKNEAMTVAFQDVGLDK